MTVGVTVTEISQIWMGKKKGRKKELMTRHLSIDIFDNFLSRVPCPFLCVICECNKEIYKDLLNLCEVNVFIYESINLVFIILNICIDYIQLCI